MVKLQSDAAIVGRRNKDASATEALDACEKDDNRDRSSTPAPHDRVKLGLWCTASVWRRISLQYSNDRCQVYRHWSFRKTCIRRHKNKDK